MRHRNEEKPRPGLHFAVPEQNLRIVTGEGGLVVGPFSTTTNPDKPGVIQKVAELPCEGGGYVQVVMKWDGFAWVQEAVYNAATNEGSAE